MNENSNKDWIIRLALVVQVIALLTGWHAFGRKNEIINDLQFQNKVLELRLENAEREYNEHLKAEECETEE